MPQVSLLTCGLGAIPMSIIGLIKSIIYLTKSGKEFNKIYVEEKRVVFKVSRINVTFSLYFF